MVNKEAIIMTDEQFKQFVRDRITQLRLQKGVSAYRMSCDLGRGKGYIHSICAGKHMPSLEGFVAICNYLGITLRELFDAELLALDSQDEQLYYNTNRHTCLSEIAKSANGQAFPPARPPDDVGV